LGIPGAGNWKENRMPGFWKIFPGFLWLSSRMRAQRGSEMACLFQNPLAGKVDPAG